MGVTLYFANFLIKRSQNYRGATAGNAQLYFEPATLTLPQSSLVNVWVAADKAVAFARVEFTFDPTRLMLTQEIILANPMLTRVTKKSTMAEANASGKVIIIAGVDPSTLATAPTGSFKLATLSLAPKVRAISKPPSRVTANLQLVDNGYLLMSRHSRSVEPSPLHPDADSTSTPAPAPTYQLPLPPLPSTPSASTTTWPISVSPIPNPTQFSKPSNLSMSGLKTNGVGE
jgi:hypothetical protein